MAKPSSDKSLWEYILLAISGLGTIVQVLSLISDSQTLLAKPAVTITFVILIMVGAIVGCVFVLYRSKPGTFVARVPYYSQSQRWAAGGILATNLIVSTFVLTSIFVKPCIPPNEQFAAGKFGILVADFTEGVNRTSTPKGSELADRTLNALTSRLATSSISDYVEVKRACAIRSSDEAIKVGMSGNAALVLWGNVAEYANNTFEPSFTFVEPLLWTSDVNPLLFEVELNRVDSNELPSKISARATSLSAFVIGLIYLKEAQNVQKYDLAVREFSFAIANTEPELTNLVPGSEQDLVLRRTLATFFVMRGSTYAALGESEKALADYEIAEARDKSYPSTYAAKGNYYYAIQNFSQAEIEYKKAISLRDVPTAYYGLGNVLFYTGRYQDSIDAHLKAISLIEAEGNDPSGVRLVLGMIYQIIGQNQFALEQLNKVLESTKATNLQKQTAREMIASILDPTSTVTVVTLLPPPPKPTRGVFPTQKPPLTPAESATPVIVVNAPYLRYMRQGPNTLHPFTFPFCLDGTQTPDQQVILLSRDPTSTWFFVRMQQVEKCEGWLYRDWLELDSINLSEIPIAAITPTIPPIPPTLLFPTRRPKPTQPAPP